MDREPIGPPALHDDDRDHVVVLRGVSWSHYEGLLRARGERPAPKLAFVDGELEIMTVGRDHELDKKLIARLLEIYALEFDLVFAGAGNTTFRDKARQAGLEPDECYYLNKLEDVPHVAVEVVHTSGGVDKLEIYRRLRVREVWFYIDAQFYLYRLERGRYKPIAASVLVPDFDFAAVAKLVDGAHHDRQTQIVRAFQRALRRRR